MMPKIVNKLHGPHVLHASPTQQRIRENPTESTGAVLAKNPLKVKLENSHNSKALELR